MEHLDLKPGHAAVKAYYRVLGEFGQLHIDHEMAVSSAFQDLLSSCARKFHWMLVPEFSIERKGAAPIRVDGAVLDTFKLTRGLWEAKDSDDNLDKEIKAKLAVGYPKQNIIFQAPERAVLYQNGVRQGLNEDITDAKNLVELLKQFFEYRLPHHEEWEQAVKEFSERLPEIAGAVQKLIEQERKTNQKFVQSFEAFYAVCRQAINPNLSVQAVETMLVQHLLTERIFRKIFDNPDFARRNVVATEIEKVIDSLTSRHFNREEFLRGLDRFYKAIELSAENTENYSEKQAFLNTVYERFFQGYSPKEADTHGIVYTPQPIVNFMVRSVEEILQKEFGRSLSDRDVHILDPFVGTGNFIVRVMREIKTSALPYKYENELHCNEVMLLPYYIASMNIEHEYLERIGEYKPFPGICLVDTFELAESKQTALFTEENTQRVERQKQAPIFVILGNPPYNAWQLDENDNNKNRQYPQLDRRVAETFARDSSATLTSSLNDPYVRAFRWATDRIAGDGIVAFVTNGGFLDSRAADGLRQHLRSDYSEIFILDLGGNVRRNPKLSGTTHNVFGIKVGVSVNLLVRRSTATQRPANVWYANVGASWRKEQKYNFLEEVRSHNGVRWAAIPADAMTWVPDPSASEFSSFLQLSGSEESLFASDFVGVSSQRDAIVYGFDRFSVRHNCETFIKDYNAQVYSYATLRPQPQVDDFAANSSVKWSQTLKRKLQAGTKGEYNDELIRRAEYRPFTGTYLYYDPLLVDRPGGFDVVFRGPESNVAICVTGPGSEKPFMSSTISNIPDSHFVGPGCTTKCFPFFTYGEDGTGRRENITDRALEQFRAQYKDASISKWDIFHYVYAALHHPTYRERYAANLRRELPRIPFLKARPSGRKNGGPQDDKGVVLLGKNGGAQDDKAVFWALVKAGERLADLHVNYEKQPEYPLKRVESGQLDWRVQKMRLGKDKTSLVYNGFLTLSGIPPETYEYRLGNRSALEWVIDQYQVTTDKRSGITNDPNRADDPEYIVRLIGQVVYVSLETVKIVKSLPEFVIEASEAAKV
jgi:predicted helicase